MSIVTVKGLNKYIKALESEYENLMKVVRGEEPNPNIYNLYHDNPEQYSKEFREIEELDIRRAIHNFEGILKELKSLKSIRAKQIHKEK